MDTLFAVYRERHYRDDIQGIRALGAVLILIFHIWASKVSGGVDVFFAVSGFLMTRLLLRQQAREGRLLPWQFWAGIARRIAPVACLVLLATLILGYFFLPPLFWRNALNDLLFSALQLENVQLMRLSVDYLARENPASPFQQFWALSMQMQFYLLLPPLLAAGIWCCRRRGARWPLVALFSTLALTSFAYSVAATRIDPNPAYFDTAARLWEFLAGGLLAMAFPYLRLPARAAASLSVLGLGLLLGTGILLPASLNFPGYAALVPVTGALLLIIAGSLGTAPANRLLADRRLVKLGNVSFSLYLWHWPLLVYTQHQVGSPQLNLAQGAAVIAVAFLLAAGSARLVEHPLRRIPRSKPLQAYALAALCFVPALLPATAARQYVVSFYELLEQAPPVSSDAEPRIAVQDDASGVSLEQFATVASDKSFTFVDCLEGGQICESGDTESDRVVALVGGSHAAHWEPFFSHLGQTYGFKVVSLLQISCALGYQEWRNADCKAYNEEIVDTLRELDPVFVVTNSTRSDRHDQSDTVEYLPPAYPRKWRELNALGIPVLGIRDNPWFQGNPSLCVWHNPHSAGTCARPVDELFVPDDPAQVIDRTMPLFHSVDFTELFCDAEQCPSVVDDRLIYFDSHHFTRSYLLAMAPMVETLLQKQAPEFLARLARGKQYGEDAPPAGPARP